jgi:hypothetical protein
MYLHMPSGEDDQSNRNQLPGINKGERGVPCL